VRPTGGLIPRPLIAAVCIGPGPAAESYLNIPRLISAAEVTESQAIHPGYGFLSENAHFNQVCRDCQMTFIGPPPEAMHRLRNKNQARKLAQQAGVPVVPGSEGLIDKDADVVAIARRIGFPRC
jgi:acetyl-CoA carboxylase biotin carboxylase subunit